MKSRKPFRKIKSYIIKPKKTKRHKKHRNRKNCRITRKLSLLNKHIHSPLKINQPIQMPINNPFFDKSKGIADDFIQSIVFLDDRAFSKDATTKQDDNKHDFDAYKISKAFAAKQKICAVYDPETLNDIENFKEISKKADVVIIDWFIEIEDDSYDDLEADVEVNDPRGFYTIDILKEIILDSQKGKDSLKLIVIYTGETNLEEITDKIHSDLVKLRPNLEKSLCKILDKNIKILVIAKSSVNEDDEDTKFNHLPQLKDRIIKYSQLPNFILNEFTEMTAGLLSNFALLSLTTIRKNSHKILSLFSKELDSAFLSHKSLLPYTDDAEEFLIQLIKDSISDLLLYNGIHTQLNQEMIKNWVESTITIENHSVLKKNGDQYIPDELFERNHMLILSLLYSSNIEVDKRYQQVFKDLGLSSSKAEEYYKHLCMNNTSLFMNKINQNDIEIINKRFATLTHHKSLFLPQSIQPKLTLGTIMKSIKNESSYFICIQQKCDSVRINKDEERKFLFLPLKKVTDNKFDVVTPDGIKLKRDKKSFSLRTIIFKCNNDDGVIKGELNASGKYIYKQKYIGESDEQFEWVLDLKDLHSQRIVTDYASVLSRVGLDESEWLRRSSS